MLSSIKSFVQPIESQTMKLIARGQGIMRRRRSGNSATDLNEKRAFRKEIEMLMQKSSHVTKQARNFVQKRRATAVHNQMLKKRDGLRDDNETEEINIYDAFQAVLKRLINVPIEMCIIVLGKDRCNIEIEGKPTTNAPLPTTLESANVDTTVDFEESTPTDWW